MTLKDVIDSIIEDPVEAVLSLIIWLGIFAVVPFMVLLFEAMTK